MKMSVSVGIIELDFESGFVEAEAEVSGMCDSEGRPASVTDALGMLDRALGYLATADTAALPTSVQADALLALAKVEAKHTAARSRVLAAFATRGGYEEDGHRSARSWLRWRAKVTRGAAAGAIGWVRRLSAHPLIGEALAAGELSESWARQICEWTDRLPQAQRGDADEILAGAACGGADLSGLAGLAQEMYERSHPDGPDDLFDERYLRLGITFRGAGRAEGDLTPRCAAVLDAVLEKLGKKAGPEDTRTVGQRRHDALEEACTRLIASGILPDGRPDRAYLHMTLAQLRNGPGASEVEAAWAAARAAQPGWLTGVEAGAAACDSTIVPMVTGHVDWAALDRFTAAHLATHSGQDGCQCAGSSRGCADGGCGCTVRRPLSPQTLERLRATMLRLAADVLSGPGGLASWLRQSQFGGGPGGGTSLPLGIPLPLDTGEAEPAIPAHLRRAVTTRHIHCAFPGCQVPATGCHIHHLVPRARGGPTALGNLVPLCAFHHLTAIHRWGWTLSMHADGSITATSPNRARVLRDHGPPGDAVPVTAVPVTAVPGAAVPGDAAPDDDPARALRDLGPPGDSAPGDGPARGGRISAQRATVALATVG
jgi:Domain of unknown function (DUF222)